MHKLLSITCVFILGLSIGRAQSVNIATWMVELPETSSTNPAVRAAEFAPVLGRVADALKPLNADVVLLHGISSRTVTKQLTDLLRPRVYHNPLLSAFRKNPQSTKLVEPSITILSRKQPVMARTIEWRTIGAIEAPGGFSVAVFNHGSNGLFLFTAQFPKPVAGMTAEQLAAVPRHRELAARYLVSHADWLSATATNAGKFAYLAADLELEGAALTNDPVARILHEGGFKASSGNRSLIASTALSSTGWPPEGALVSAFVRGTEFPGDPESIGAKTFFAPVALVDVDLRPIPGAAAPAHSVVSTPASTIPPRQRIAPATNAFAASSIAAAVTPAATTVAAPEPVVAPRPATPPPVAPAAPVAVSPVSVAGQTATPVSPALPVSHPPANAAASAPAVAAGTPHSLASAAPSVAGAGRWVAWAENRTIAVGGAIAAGFLLILTLLLRSGRPSESRRMIEAGSAAVRPALTSPDRRVAQLEAQAQAQAAAASIHVLETADEARLASLSSARAARRESEGEQGSDPGEDAGRTPKGSSWPFLHLLRERMVRWLAAERSQLLSSHHAGAEQVLELEERLTRIQDQFESRLRAREKRISELEVELMTKERSIADLEHALTGRDRRN